MIFGRLKIKQATLNAYLDKDTRESRVYINDEYKTGASEIKTKYTVIGYDQPTNTSMLDIELITGKTHQIRAHMAYIQHPIVGDGKYGTNELNKKAKKQFKLKYQALIAYKIVFSFNTSAGHLEYLKNMMLEIDPVFK